MKKLILFFAFFIVAQIGNTQCCPYLDNAELTPTNPTQLDSVYLITKVTTPNQGKYLGYTITETDSLLLVEACYYNGLLTALQTYNDTINLGLHPAGELKVKFVAWTSSSDTTCTFVQNQSTESSVMVEASNAVEAPFGQSLAVFPNPSADIFYIELEGYRGDLELEICSPVGQLLQTINLKNNQDDFIQRSFDLKDYSSGMYLLKIQHEQTIEVRKLNKL
ncbi:MAG: T9SS type A sorting domain-containing protein [Bacteroidota bacterium]